MATAITLIAIVLALILFFVYASRSGAKLMKQREDRLGRAEKGSAKILGFSAVGLRGTGSGGEYQAYKFTLEVSNAYKAAYKTSSVWAVFPMGAPSVQVDKEVDVKIDTDDNNIIYPLVNGVEFSWTGEMMDRAHNQK